MTESMQIATEQMLYSPSLPIQIASLGGSCRYLWQTASANPNVLYNNTSLFRDGSQLVVAQRRLMNLNGQVTVEWRDNPSSIVLVSKSHPAAQWSQLGTVNLLDQDPSLSVEDARIVNFTADSKIMLAAVWHFQPNAGAAKTRAVTSQALIGLNSNYEVTHLTFPNIGDNLSETKYEKNWMPILGTNYFSYTLHDRHIVHNYMEFESYETLGINWAYGAIHGGSQWVRDGSTMLGIFHSSIAIDTSWQGAIPHNGKYFLIGAVRAESEPPFRLLAYTPSPLLWSSANNPRVRNGSILLFVNGLAIHEGDAELALGVNDAASAYVRIPLKEINKRLSPIPR